MKHIIIIGAGLTGAALAYRLSHARARVTVIETATPAAAASGASFGWINASFFHSRPHFNLRRAAIAAHHRLDRDLGDTGIFWSGTLWLGSLWWEAAGTDFDSHAATLTALEYPLHILTRAEIAAREPALAAPDRALFLPDEGAVDAARLTRRLLAASGATLWSGCPVTAIEPFKVHTAQGTLAADHIILAAGTACRALLAPLGLTLPMLDRPGLVLVTRPIKTRLSHILASPTQEVRQDIMGRLIAPLSAAHQSAAHQPDKTDRITPLPGDLARGAMGRLRALLPGVDLDLAEVRAAHRPVPGDGLPAIGLTGIDGISLAVMHSGVTLAPLIADLLTDEVLGAPPSPLLADFRPSRFF